MTRSFLLAVLPPTRLGRWFVLLLSVGFLVYTLQLTVGSPPKLSSPQVARDETALRKLCAGSPGLGSTTVTPPPSSMWHAGLPAALHPGERQAPQQHFAFDHKNILPTASGRVLVTGGGGMIGQRVVRRLLEANIPVTVLDKIFYEDEENSIRQDWPGGDLRVVRGDLRDAATLEDAITDAKGVIHLAAVSRVLWCLENLQDCTDVNVRGTELVINALKGGWFIQASSREVYGNLDALPVAEDATRNPANVYGRSKAEAEDVVTSHVEKVTEERSKRINAIMLRLSNVYGSTKDHPERLIPAIVRNALSNRPIQMVGGDQDLDMVFVEDVVDAISLSVTRLHRKTNSWVASSKGHVEVFNVGTPTSTSAMSLIQKTMWLTNSSSPLRIVPADDRFPSRYLGSTVKAATELGYQARVSVDEGLYRLALDTLRETVTFLRDKPASEPYDCFHSKKYTSKDLLALDGCVGNLLERGPKGETTFNHYHPKKEDGPERTNKFIATQQPTTWNFTVKPSEINDDEVRVRFDFSPEKQRDGTQEADYTLGIPSPEEGVDSEFEFLASVHPTTGFINLRKLSGQPLYDNRTFMGEDEYNYRITPVCCEGKSAPWPFFRDDAIASNVLDNSTSLFQSFETSSQIKTVCSRLKAAVEYAVKRVEMLERFSFPIILQESPLPQGRAPDWRMRRYTQICTNLCDHPTFCVDTGSCLCGHAAQCTPRTRFPFSNVANMNTLSYPVPQASQGGDDALVKRIARSSWANIINQDARRYFGSTPEWPPLTSVRSPPEMEQIKKDNATEFWRIRNSFMGCFSADTAMELASRHASKQYQLGKSLVFVPYYVVNDWITHFSQDPSYYYDYAVSQLGLRRQTEIEPNDVIMAFTHDIGRCIHGSLDPVVFRHIYIAPTERHRRLTVWAPMGDLNTQCYYPDQDVVIPSRTCLSPQLHQAFSDVAKVKPSRQRKVLAHFKGTLMFASSILRQKLKCYRPMKAGNLTGWEELEMHWHRLRPGNNYIETINETVFCPVPRGTTGWATRTADVVYGGCIPVIIGQETHHPFWDVLDWSKFAVFVNEWDIERLEEILLSYSWEEVEQMQANLMLARDAFIYPDVGKEHMSIKERTPFWYAAHSSWLRKLTKYPT